MTEYIIETEDNIFISQMPKSATKISEPFFEK